jgi:hypothetical protein
MISAESIKARITKVEAAFDGEVEVMSNEKMLRSIERGLHSKVYIIHSVRN